MMKMLPSFYFRKKTIGDFDDFVRSRGPTSVLHTYSNRLNPFSQAEPYTCGLTNIEGDIDKVKITAYQLPFM